MGPDADAAGIADLLERGGMPRSVAFEERYVVAEEGGKVRAALRYRRGPGRLLLGLLVVDPSAGRDPFGERRLVAALRAGADELARAEGLEAVARSGGPQGSGHRPSGGRRRRALALWARLWGRAGTPPFFAPFRDRSDR